MKHLTLRDYLVCLAFGLLVYVALAHVVFAFRHPHLTDTQRLLRLGDAVLFRVEEGTQCQAEER